MSGVVNTGEVFVQKHLFIAVLLAATANFFWAANAIVGKVVVAELPAFTLSQFRWIGAFLILAPFGLSRIRRQWDWYRQRLPQLVGLSILSVTLYNTLQYWALEHTEPVKVGAMLALMPLAIAIVSSFFGSRRLSLPEWATASIAVIGAVTVISDGQWRNLLGGSGFSAGEVLMLVAITSWAFYSVFLKNTVSAQIDVIGLLTFFVGSGTVMILPFWVYDMLTETVFLPSGGQWGAVAFVALFPSVVSLLCWNMAVRLSDANIAGLMVTTAPLFNALLTIVFLQHAVSGAQWVGIALVMTGVASTLLIARRNLSANAV